MSKDRSFDAIGSSAPARVKYVIDEFLPIFPGDDDEELAVWAVAFERRYLDLSPVAEAT